MMGATQVDRFGNRTSLRSATGTSPDRSCSGTPGNTINHTTSYWVPNHSPKVFVEAVDVVCGIGYMTGPPSSGRTSYGSTRSAGSCPTWACSTSSPGSDGGDAVPTMRVASVHPA